ncbi:hypothetical protein JD844_002627 [Phrynosoma platyrhinos]|uniref:SH3 domain-containing protein n=1 Tax=Phrynosoma platyrhinos TaxID=52577 RepID=A0ABQ7TDC8_PHRPL|nr:hypothetical protein JD844_002627 [Phrynosoma platyrhinos]
MVIVRTSNELVQPPDSSKSLSLCNLVMEENPNSGSTEDVNKAQTDLGSLNLGLDGSAASESQEKAAGGGPLLSPEAEQTSTESSGALATTTWPEVGQQEDGATWTASIDGNENTFPEPYLDSSHVMDSGTDLVETNEPLVGETLVESPEVKTDSFLDGDPFSMEETKEEKQETEESLWANVEPCEKVEIRDVKCKELDCTEKLPQRDCDNKSYSELDQHEALAKTEHETMKSIKGEAVRESEYDNRQPETVGNCLQEVGPEFNEVLIMQQESKGDAEDVVNIRLGYEVSDCTAVECGRFETEKGLGLWNQDHGTVCVDDLPTAGNVAINWAQENEMANLTGLAKLEIRDKSTGEAEKLVCGEEIHGTEEPDKASEDHSHNNSESSNFADDYQVTFIPFENDMVLQPSSDTANPNLNHSWLDNVEDKYLDGEAFSMAEELDNNFSFPEAMEMDPWQANWDPTVNNDSWGFSSQVNGSDNWPFPPTKGSVDGNMENPWSGFNEKWSTEDLGGLDNSWGAAGIIPSHQNQETPLRQGSSGEQANISSFGPNKEIGRPLVLFKMGNSRNASTESSTSPKDNETNSSDLSEDEIANRRYGLLYQEIEADKEEDTSLFSVQSSQNVMDNMAETEEAPSLELQKEEAPRAPDAVDTAAEPEAQPAEAAGEPAAETVDAVEAGIKEAPEHVEKECELQMDSVVEDAAEAEAVDVTPVMEGGEVAAAPTVVQESDIPLTEEKAGESQENLSNIPSVIIEPASNNEGDGEDHEVLVNESKDAVEDLSTQDTEGLVSETSETVSEPKISKDVQPASSEEQTVSAHDDMPPGFLYKVEALHDFEAANSDELNLRRGDIVLVVPSVAAADQEAGWLTGIRECDWLQCRDATTCKGLFPENFTCRRE